MTYGAGVMLVMVVVSAVAVWGPGLCEATCSLNDIRGLQADLSLMSDKVSNGYSGKTEHKIG